MLQIRRDQKEMLARNHAGTFLAADFTKAGATASYEPDSGEVLVSNHSGETARLALDSEGRVTKLTTPLGRVSEFRFRGRHLDSISAANGLESRFLYDEQSRPVSAEIGADHRYSFGYDDSGNLARLSFPDRTAFAMEYTAKRQLKTFRNRRGDVVRFEHDDLDDLVALVDPAGHATRFEYGAWDRPERITYADGGSEAFEYSKTGQLSRISWNGVPHAQCDHDDYGRLTGVHYTDGHFVQFEYDAAGRVVQAENPAITVQCEYDEWGHLIREDQADAVIQYQYDDAGQLTDLVLPDGATISYAYDPDGRIEYITDWEGQKHEFRYSRGDQPEVRLLPNGLQENYTYDSSLHLKQMEIIGRRLLWRQEYESDSGDRIVRLVDSRTGSVSLAYDAEGRLRSFLPQKGPSEAFEYDSNGNLARHNGLSFTHDAVNRPLRSPEGSYEYDDRGNRIAEISTRGGVRYTYNGQDLLTRVEVEGDPVEFGYDAFGRRVFKTAGGVTTRYLWSGHQMIAEITAEGAAQERREYLYFPGTHKPLALRVNGEVYYYHNDQLGTPQLLTDSSGAVVWDGRYRPFGVVREGANQVRNPLRFPGQYLDEETGLHYNRTRYYDPSTAGYLSRDLSGFLTGTNFYAYAGGDPINIADPLAFWGESLPGWAKTTISVAGTAAVGIGVGLAAAALAPVALGAAVVAGIAIAAGAIAAGAAGFGLNAAMTKGASVPCEMLRGAGVGALASLPFIAFPLTTAVGALMGLGALSGAIGYVADWAGNNQPWSTQSLLLSVGLGAATAGLFAAIAPRLGSLLRRAPAEVEGEGAAANSKLLRAIEERPKCGEPIDAVTGEVCIQKTDFRFPGALDLVLERAYASGLEHSSCFGPKWRSTWGQWVSSENHIATFHTSDGRSIDFDLGSETSREAGWLSNPLVNKIRLRREEREFQVRDGNRRTLFFAREVAGRWLLTQIADPNGNSITFEHDSEGALRRVLHSGGYRLKVEGTRSQIHRIDLEDGTASGTELMRYEYDSAGYLSAVIDASGLPFKYEYDQAGRVTKWRDRERTWYEYRYDGEGRCVEAFGPEGMYHYCLLYDEQERTNRSVDSTGATTSFVYNQRLQIVERRDARGGVTRTVWDERSNKLRETDPSGRTAVCRYDADGNLTTFMNPLGHITTALYNADGLPAQVTDAKGSVWKRTYDARGNLIAASDPVGFVWKFERDEAGNVVRIVDPLGNAREFGYDLRGLPVWTTDWSGRKTSYECDALGRVVAEIDPLGFVIRVEYDSLGKPLLVSRPDGTELQWHYDAEGNLLRRRLPDGKTVSFSYGLFDLLTILQRPSGGKVQFSYDTEGRLAAVANERGEVYHYEYNATGQVVSEKDFSGRHLRFEYDASGLCVKRINGLGQETIIQRNDAGQIVRKQSQGEAESVFDYDELGRILRARNENIEILFDRDAYGRVLSEQQGERWVESEYDARGLRKSRRTANGHELKLEYDRNGLLSGLQLPGDAVFKFERDPMGREVERSMRFGSTPAEHLILRQEFDSLDRLTRQWMGLAEDKSLARSEAAITERNYRYNLTGDPIEISDQRWGSSVFTYDADGRIATARRNDTQTEEFDYDLAGNIARTTVRLSDTVERAKRPVRFKVGLTQRYYSRGGRLERRGAVTYVYDADGRVVEKREGKRNWRFEWTVEGLLSGLRTPSGVRWQYEYDAFGRRIGKTGSASVTTYLWDGNVVAEDIEAGEGSASWVFEPGGFRPVAKQQGGVTYACVTDHIGSPKELLSSKGAVLWSAQLDVWGQDVEAAERVIDCPIRFQGQWFDAESGLHYNFHRYYDPETGQYLSPDPTGLAGGTRSYGYVHNPLSWVDPIGLMGCEGNEAHSAAGYARYKESLARQEFAGRAQWKPSDPQFGDMLNEHAFNRHPSLARGDNGIADAQLYDARARANIVNLSSEIHSIGPSRYAAFNPGTSEFTVFSWQGEGGLAPGTPTIHSYYARLLPFKSFGQVSMLDVSP